MKKMKRKRKNEKNPKAKARTKRSQNEKKENGSLSTLFITKRVRMVVIITISPETPRNSMV